MMDEAHPTRRPSKLTFSTSNTSKERLATEIGRLNSPYPEVTSFEGLQGRLANAKSKMPIVDKKPANIQSPGAAVIRRNGFAVGSIVDQRATNHGLEFKIRWEETWVPEQEVVDRAEVPIELRIGTDKY